jgi:hypothetical protein
VKLSIADVWFVMQCSLVCYQRFGGTLATTCKTTEHHKNQSLNVFTCLMTCFITSIYFGTVSYWPFAGCKALAGMRGDGWRHAVRQRYIHPSQKFDATTRSEKNYFPHNSFFLQTFISSSGMFSRWTIKHSLLLPTLPRSVGICSPTSPV